MADDDTDLKNYALSIARIEQRLDDRKPVIENIDRRSSENAAALARLETRTAAMEAVLQNGLVAMVKEIHQKMAEHAAREELVMQLAKEERAQLSDKYQSLVGVLIKVGGVVIVAALTTIGYLFSLNFGTP